MRSVSIAIDSSTIIDDARKLDSSDAVDNNDRYPRRTRRHLFATALRHARVVQPAELPRRCALCNLGQLGPRGAPSIGRSFVMAPGRARIGDE